MRRALIVLAISLFAAANTSGEPPPSTTPGEPQAKAVNDRLRTALRGRRSFD